MVVRKYMRYFQAEIHSIRLSERVNQILRQLLKLILAPFCIYNT